MATRQRTKWRDIEELTAPMTYLSSACVVGPVSVRCGLICVGTSFAESSCAGLRGSAVAQLSKAQ